MVFNGASHIDVLCGYLPSRAFLELLTSGRHPERKRMSSIRTPGIPDHTVHGEPGDSTTSISIHGWTISSTSLPISNAPEIDAMHEALKGLPVPEMPFGNNSVVLRYEASGWEYTFNALEALQGVKLGELGEGDGGVKVMHAKAWLQSR